MNKTIRNIIIVALFTVGGGWLGIWLNNVTGNTQPPMQSLGALVWLVSPALSGFLLRAFGGDGWKDSGFGLNLPSGWKWYLVAILVYPLASLLSFGLALALKAISIDGFIEQGFGAYVSAIGVIFGGSLIKNFFEEFAWRGYLTPRLDAAKVHPLLNHLIVGVLWWSWHLPYYYYFLDKAVLQNFLQTNLPTFLVTALIVLFPTSILFGELRLASKTTWTAFILHNIINALSMPLIINGFIKLNGTMGLIFTPTNDGIITSIFMGIAGLVLYQNRMKNSNLQGDKNV
jgi:membrane protease YdiL (CAAX protease family)